MTRQIFILIVSLGIIILGGICETKYLNKSCNYVMSDIEYIENALNNNNIEVAKNQIKDVEYSWENVKDSWNIFVQNDLTYQIDESLGLLKENINLERKEEALIYAKKLRNNLQDIVNRQRINLENVL